MTVTLNARPAVALVGPVMRNWLAAAGLTSTACVPQMLGVALSPAVSHCGHRVVFRVALAH